MSSIHTNTEPKLQPPGAGIPFLQAIYLRYWLGPNVAKKMPPAESRKHYENLTQKLIARVSAVPVEQRKIRVLVAPIPGLEDSSRYWSLNGTLEHLLIVTRNIERIVLSLSSGVVPQGEVGTAKVKPKNQELDSLAEFIQYAPGVMHRLDLKLAEPGMDLNSQLQFKHPWFGGFTARQWYWLLGAHLTIHFQQTKQIIAGYSNIKDQH